MPSEITTERLARHPEALPVLATWFESEWPDWYGPGGPGNAEEDLLAYANEGDLPMGIAAFQNGLLCGVAALKAVSIPSHLHLSPWAAAGFVIPSLRGQGIGAALLTALESEARALGYSHLYCGTATAASLLLRLRWHLIEFVEREGQKIGLYGKALCDLP